MRVVIYHDKYFEWEPVPEDVVLTEQDVLAGKVRPAARQLPGKPRFWHGNWDMKVTRDADTHTEFHVDEGSIFHASFHKDVRPLRLTRRQAVALFLSKYAIPERFPESTVTDVSVHDDGPDEKVYHALLSVHFSSGLLNQAQYDDLAAKYLEPLENHAKAHQAHLEAHFGVKPADETKGGA